MQKKKWPFKTSGTRVAVCVRRQLRPRQSVHLVRASPLNDYESATAGADALRRGLEKLATANAVMRRTGRVWNVLTQHPGIEQRIERLRLEQAAGPPTS